MIHSLLASCTLYLCLVVLREVSVKSLQSAQPCHNNMFGCSEFTEWDSVNKWTFDRVRQCMSQSGRASGNLSLAAADRGPLTSRTTHPANGFSICATFSSWMNNNLGKRPPFPTVRRMFYYARSISSLNRSPKHRFEFGLLMFYPKDLSTSMSVASLSASWLVHSSPTPLAACGSKLSFACVTLSYAPFL